MYMYYALTSLRIRCPWKRAVTSLQIMQFILDLGVVYFASYSHVVAKYALPLPVMGSCAAGKEHAVISGVSILSSYLVLFIIFYRKTYNRKPSRANVNVTSASSSPTVRSPLREKDQSEVLSSSYKRVTRSGGLAVPTEAEKRPSTPQLEEAGKR